MGLFDFFGKKDDAAAIKKLIAKGTQKYGDPQFRQKALEELRDIGTPEALTGLMQRFTVRVEPGITDDEEKNFVFESLVDAGAAAVEPLKRFIERAEQPTWALRALEKLVPAADYVGTILGALEREGAEYTRDPDKKITLLRHLEERQDPRVAPALVPFLADMNEDVRVAAVKTVATHPPDDSTREPLIQALLHAQEERSERMRKAVAEALVRLGHSVKGFTPSVQAALPPGYVIDKEGVVKTK